VQLESSQFQLDSVNWQVPPFEAAPRIRIGWVEEQIQEGEGYLQGQSCYRDLGKNLRVFDAIFKDTTRSTLVTNELKYSIRKFCETLAEVREIATYGSDVPAFKQIAEMLTKVSKAVYLESDFPFQVLRVLQFASVMGIGYIWPKVRADEYGYGERQMVFDALGLLDVIGTQIPKSNNIQDAYAVTIYDYMPIAEAHGRFPLFQGQLQTVGPRNYKTQMQAKRLDFAERFRYGEQGRSFGNLYTEIRYTFVRDLRINNTGFELPMGDAGTSWFYKVPFVGQEIFGGMVHGQPFARRAKVEDCRVYPNLRLMITSSGIDRPLYDGPAFDWDSKIPVIQLTVDDWAWEPGGRSLVGDVGSIETTTRKIERKVDQVITATLNPPIGYDHTATGGPKIEHFDIFEPDVRYGVDGKPKDILQSILPEEVRADQVHFKFLEYLKNCMQAQLGLVDLGNLQNMKMNIANDTADKMLESIGPIAKGIAARIEKMNKSIGHRMKFLILQWFNTQRLMEYVGPDNMAREMFDFNPDQLVPSHLPDEMIDGTFPTEASHYDQLTRAKWFAKRIRLTSVPSTLLRITQMQEQLKYLQLKRGQAPISWSTVMKKLDVQNYGEVPGVTEREKFFNETVEMQKMQIIAQVQAMQFLKQLGIDPSQLQGGDQGGGGGGKGGGGGGKGGRKPSGQKPAQIKQKGGQGGDPRTTVTES
jgi:hypothetical protein